MPSKKTCHEWDEKTKLNSVYNIVHKRYGEDMEKLRKNWDD